MNAIQQVAVLILAVNKLIDAVSPMLEAVGGLRTMFGGDASLPRLVDSLEAYKRAGRQVIEDGEKWLREHPVPESIGASSTSSS